MNVPMSGNNKMKAYKAWDEAAWIGSTVVFAESARRAKTIAFHHSDLFEDSEYIDIRVIRYRELDKAYRGKYEMEWDDPDDRKALCEVGFTCMEDWFDPDDCKTCSGQEYCDMYRDYLKECEDEKQNDTN